MVSFKREESCLQKPLKIKGSVSPIIDVFKTFSQDYEDSLEKMHGSVTRKFNFLQK